MKLTFNMHQAPRIALLTGPPGSGKTATVRAVCSDLSIAVQEWSPPNEIVSYQDKVMCFFLPSYKTANFESHCIILHFSHLPPPPYPPVRVDFHLRPEVYKVTGTLLFFPSLFRGLDLFPPNFDSS